MGPQEVLVLVSQRKRGPTGLSVLPKSQLRWGLRTDHWGSNGHLDKTCFQGGGDRVSGRKENEINQEVRYLDERHSENDLLRTRLRCEHLGVQQ